MDAPQREQIRLSLLRFLNENPTRFGMARGLLVQMLRSEGNPTITGEQVETELLYLEDKGLIQEAAKYISPENRAWRITAEGRDLLANIQA